MDDDNRSLIPLPDASLANMASGAQRIMSAMVEEMLALTRQEQSVHTAGLVRAAPLSWQEQVVQNHPEIGIAGTDGNRGYVSAYNDAKAAREKDPTCTFDPIVLADSVMKPIYEARNAVEAAKPEPDTTAAEPNQKAGDGGDTNAPSNLKRHTPRLELQEYEEIVFAFSDLIATHSPLIGDCAMLPHSKETILYAIKFVADSYETELELTANHTLAESYEKLIPTLNYLFTILARDWHEIAPEDKNAIHKLSEYDSFPDWALSLKLKYIDEDRARNEACNATLRVMKDKADREKERALESDGR